MRKAILTLILLAACFQFATAQVVTLGDGYTVKMLSQESVKIYAQPMPFNAAEVGDTTFTLYEGGTVDLKHYFVNGDQYDNIFNPNPTGVYINGQNFIFFCGIEMAIRQNFANLLDVYEFEYLGKKYLVLVNFREDCLGEGCRYRCYNVFDITNPSKIYQVAFSSFYEGSETFGEFNNDGALDFVRAAPKPPRDMEKGEIVDHYLITAYSFENNKPPKQLFNSQGHAYYLYVKGDEEVKAFNVLKADWFFPVKDTSGKIAPSESYFAPYISFDPLYRHLYNPEGVRIEKNRWSLYITDLGDLEAAQEYCRRIQQQEVEDVFIMIDQYSGEIKFQVFVGNYMSRDSAVKQQQLLNDFGIKSRVFDLRNEY